MPTPIRLILKVSMSSPVEDARDLHEPLRVFLEAGLRAMRDAGLVTEQFSDMHLSAANPKRFQREWEKREREVAAHLAGR